VEPKKQYNHSKRGEILTQQSVTWHIWIIRCNLTLVVLDVTWERADDADTEEQTYWLVFELHVPFLLRALDVTVTSWLRCASGSSVVLVSSEYGLLFCSTVSPTCYLYSAIIREINIKEYLFIYLLTYLLTPWSRVLLEKLTGSQLVMKFPAFYGTWRFITASTSASHLSLSWALFHCLGRTKGSVQARDTRIRFVTAPVFRERIC